MMTLNSTLINHCVVKERDLYAESYWVNDLVQNHMDDEFHLRAQLGYQEYKTLNNLTSQVCIIEMEENDQEHSPENTCEEIDIHFASIIRSVFHQHSFRTYFAIQNNRLVILAFDLFLSKTRKEQLLKKEKLQLISKQIDAVFNREKRKSVQVFMGVSSSNIGFKCIHSSHAEASKAIFLKSFFRSSVIFFDDLGAFQILLNLHEKDQLEGYVFRHLGPLLDEDRKKNSDLLKTLKIYLERNGSKQSVADELHIVRQSLYYRLNKIKELLGEDYMCTQNRLALQLAIQAYELLKVKSR
nr:helix-turn-helix domain-containing protein [Lysinibacillus timonensis]